MQSLKKKIVGADFEKLVKVDFRLSSYVIFYDLVSGEEVRSKFSFA